MEMINLKVRREAAELAVSTLLAFVGEKGREGINETPARVVKAFEEYTAGYAMDPHEVLKTFEDGADKYDEMVFQGAIPIYSLCEHHLAPFFGVAHVGYIPQGKVVGLSKISRLVDVFAKRLQVQERLTVQVADAMFEGLQAEGVGVVLRCRHLCIESRGIRKAGSMTYTSALRGSLKDEPEARAEFMKLVQMADGPTHL